MYYGPGKSRQQFTSTRLRDLIVDAVLTAALQRRSGVSRKLSIFQYSSQRQAGRMGLLRAFHR